MISTYRATFGGHSVECRQQYPGIRTVSVDGITVGTEFDDHDALLLYDAVKTAVEVALGKRGETFEDATETDLGGGPILSMSLGREGDAYTVTAKTFYADRKDAEHAFRAMSVSLREV